MRSALGKGLNALISEETAASVEAATHAGATGSPLAQGIMHVPVDRIRSNPKQPRRHFEEAALTELAQSIREKGIIQPILVFLTEGGDYEIIAGERRWRAAQQAGLQTIPAIVGGGSEAERFELALIENIQRQNLNPIEEAEGYRRLQQEFGLTQEKIAQLIGKDRAVVANMLRLLNLPTTIRTAVVQSKISMGHARALLGIGDPAEQHRLFMRILQEQLPVRDVEHVAKARRGLRKATASTDATASTEIKTLEEELQHQLGRKVLFQVAGPTAAQGWIRLEFYSHEDLEHLMKQLKTLPRTTL